MIVMASAATINTSNALNACSYCSQPHDKVESAESSPRARRRWPKAPPRTGREAFEEGLTNALLGLLFWRLESQGHRAAERETMKADTINGSCTYPYTYLHCHTRFHDRGMYDGVAGSVAAPSGVLRAVVAF